jgi:hypothetical protein
MVGKLPDVAGWPLRTSSLLATLGWRKNLTPVKTSCPQKRALLNEYLRKLDTVSSLTREHAEAVACGSNVTVLAAIKDRIAEARKAYQDARQEYAIHCETHAC